MFSSGVGRALQLGEHGGGRRGEELHVLEAVGRDDLVLRGGGEAGARLDADDAVAEQVGVVGELVERVDRGVLVHGDGELGVVVPGAEVDDVVAVLLDVLGVGDRQPDVECDVVVAGRRGRRRRGRVGVLELDVVALLLEDGLPEPAGATPSSQPLNTAMVRSRLLVSPVRRRRVRGVRPNPASARSGLPCVTAATSAIDDDAVPAWSSARRSA